MSYFSKFNLLDAYIVLASLGRVDSKSDKVWPNRHKHYPFHILRQNTVSSRLSLHPRVSSHGGHSIFTEKKHNFLSTIKVITQIIYYLKFLSNFISKFLYLSLLSINILASVVAIVLQFITAVYFAGTTNPT